MPRYLTSALIIASVLALSGCGGGGGGGGGGGSDVPTTFDFDTTGPGGPVTLTGTVNFSNEVINSAEVAVFAERVSPTGSPIVGDHFMSHKTSVTYRFTQLPAGQYRIRCNAYNDGTGSPDMFGYYAGTVAAPIQSTAGATTVTASGTHNGLNFGIGLGTGPTGSG